MLKNKIFSFFPISLVILILAGCGGAGSSDQTITSGGSGGNQPGTGSGGGGQTSTAGSVSLAWDVPTTFVDGTPASGPVGFKVYYGTASRTYTNIIDVQNATSYSINSLSPGTYYFAITAYDSYGIESDFSIELNKTIL